MKSISTLLATAALALCSGLASAKLTPFDPVYNTMVLYIRGSLHAIAEVARAQEDIKLVRSFDAFAVDTELALASGGATFTSYSARLHDFYAANADYDGLQDEVNAQLASETSDAPEIISPNVYSDVIFDMLDEVVANRKNAALTQFVLNYRLDFESSIHADFNDVMFETHMLEFLDELAALDSGAFDEFTQVWERVHREMERKYDFASYATIAGQEDVVEDQHEDEAEDSSSSSS